MVGLRPKSEIAHIAYNDSISREVEIRAETVVIFSSLY